MFHIKRDVDCAKKVSIYWTSADQFFFYISFQNSNFEPNAVVYDDCRSEATVVDDKASVQTWNMGTNYSEAWSKAEQKARKPAHYYMTKRHSAALYIYTTNILQPVKHVARTGDRTGKQLRERSDTHSLYFYLSEAIQILRHSQVTCFSTNYTTETLLNLNTSSKPVRFSTFILAPNGQYPTKNATSFEVHTCFGANITHYSALKQNNQVLIPPYELFKVTNIQTDPQKCRVIYRLESNLNCVYDRGSNSLHRISVLPADGFWVVFAIICIITVLLALPFLIVKLLKHLETGAAYNTETPV